jgi:hypothetical protein
MNTAGQTVIQPMSFTVHGDSLGSLQDNQRKLETWQGQETPLYTLMHLTEFLVESNIARLWPLIVPKL